MKSAQFSCFIGIAIGLFGTAPSFGEPAETVSSCAASATTADRTGRAPELKRVEIGTTKPAHRFGHYYLAGQPAAEDLIEWKALGVHTVINLRMPDEVDWDERAVVESLAMRYIAIPFAGPDTLTDKKLRRVLAALRNSPTSRTSSADSRDQNDTKPILLHCASSNRVGAIWFAHRILHDGLERGDALKEAKTVGLRTMGYLEPVDDYIGRAKERRRLPNQTTAPGP